MVAVADAGTILLGHAHQVRLVVVQANVLVGVVLRGRRQRPLQIEHSLSNCRVHASATERGVPLLTHCIVAIKPRFGTGLEPATAIVFQAFSSEKRSLVGRVEVPKCGSFVLGVK